MSSGYCTYSPLPQSNSESDEFSEEELHSSTERQNAVSHISEFPKQLLSEVANTAKVTKITNYKLLDNDRDVGVTLNGFQIGADEITIIKRNNTIGKMSAKRKICFIFSLTLCIFTIVFFLWILPCEIESCPSSAVLVNYWKKDLPEIELYGPISSVPNMQKGGQNLIFLYRDSLFGKTGDFELSSGGRGGVLSLSGSDGKESWKVPLKVIAKDIDCSFLDVEHNGHTDCLVSGSDHLMKVIQSINGSELWDAHSTEGSESKKCDFEFHISLPDFDKDNVSDLLTTCTIRRTGEAAHPSSQQNYFVLISGRTGGIVGKPLEISHCSFIQNLMLERELIVSFVCSDYNRKERLQTLRLDDLLSKAKLARAQEMNVKRKGAQLRNGNEVLGRRIIVDNRGQCPANCRMFVTIKGKKNETLWQDNRNGSFGMIPVILEFGKLSGFVFKYWEWRSGNDSGLTANERANSSGSDGDNPNGGRGKSIRRLIEPKDLEHYLFSDISSEIVRTKRMLAKGFTNGTAEEANFIFRRIVETIVIITFNETDMFVANASQFELVQACKNPVSCQPDASLQKHSLLIADLDQDNSQDLVSYSSTIRDWSGDERGRWNRWRLQSTVHVIRLEAELPKLYDNKSK